MMVIDGKLWTILGGGAIGNVFPKEKEKIYMSWAQLPKNPLFCDNSLLVVIFINYILGSIGQE